MVQLKLLMKLKHSRFESSNKTADQKKKRKQYNLIWEENFKNIIVEGLESADFDPSRAFDDIIDWFSPCDANFDCKKCGRKWFSEKAMLKFSVQLDDRTLLIVREEYGQKCKHCSEHYELPTFKLQFISDILQELLIFILEEVFGITDHGIEQPSYSGRRPRSSKNKMPHEKKICEACKNGVCGIKTTNRRKKGNQPDNEISAMENLSIG